MLHLTKLNNGWGGNSGVPLSLLFFVSALCVIVGLLFFSSSSSLSKWRFSSCVVSLLLQHLAANRKKKKDNIKKQGENIPRENYVNNPQGPAVNSQVTRSRDGSPYTTYYCNFYSFSSFLSLSSYTIYTYTDTQCRHTQPNKYNNITKPEGRKEVRRGADEKGDERN